MRSQHGVGDQSAKMIKKLHDNSLKLEQFYSNMFTGLKLSFSVSSVVVCLLCVKSVESLFDDKRNMTTVIFFS